MTVSHRSALAAIALSALCVVGLVLLAALHTPAPAILSQLALGAAFAGGALATPLSGSTTSDVDPGSTVATAVPTPAPYTAAPGG